jgi:hypothetical protein
MKAIIHYKTNNQTTDAQVETSSLTQLSKWVSILEEAEIDFTLQFAKDSEMQI